MKKIFTLTMLCIGSFSLSAQTTCNNAPVISAGIHAVTLQTGSQIPAPICTTNQNNELHRGAWYKYIPSEDYSVTITTLVNGFPVIDTRMHIYSGSCNNLLCVAGNDDTEGQLYSTLTFNAMEGTTYYIAFDDNWDDSSFGFKLTENPLGPSMFTAQAVPLNAAQPYCIVDMNGDYLDDIVGPNYVDVDDDGVDDIRDINILYQAPNGSGFVPATFTPPVTTFSPVWSMAAGDFNKDGFNDLLFGHTNGAAIMLQNSTGTAFNAIHESPEFLFSQRTNFIDINNDGNLDAFVCHDIAPNVYFLNDGEDGFTYHQGGLGDHFDGGNYGSTWVDYDNDGDPDLFIAKCRGANMDAAKDELHRNDGNGLFSNVTPGIMSDFHQSWSSAWGDYDNDGDMDVLIGGYEPAEDTHKLMRNNGDGTFTNITDGSGFDDFTMINIDHSAHDFNNDGYIDIFCGGQTVMFNNGNMTFTPVQINAEVGAVGDLNNDGFLDILNWNVVHFNNTNDNNWIKINLKGIQSNSNGIGARVEVYTTTEGLEKQIRDVRSGDAFHFMSSLNAHFGIGAAESIEKVVVKWPSGLVDTINNPDINHALMVTEGEALGGEEFQSGIFAVYPNPARDIITISGDAVKTATGAAIYDINGRLVKDISVENYTIPVQSLAKGTYILKISNSEGKEYASKFIKE